MSSLPTRTQVSSGGVAFRRQQTSIEVMLISVGEKARWQLPKGRVDEGETKEQAALREVREETGIVTELLCPIEEISYWFVIRDQAERVRVHKYVHFFLMRYVSGDPQDHDYEVNEARWFEIEAARLALAFESEQDVVEKAREIILSLPINI